MKVIHVNRNGVYLGVITLDRLKKAFENGLYCLADWGWHEGLEDWQPLEYFLKIKEIPLKPAPVSNPDKSRLLRQTRRERLAMIAQSPQAPSHSA